MGILDGIKKVASNVSNITSAVGKKIYKTIGNVTKSSEENLVEFCDNADYNRKIEDTKQGKIGDCWLLSGVNALSYTEKGREIIRNMLEYQDDKVIVHLKCGDYRLPKGMVENTGKRASSGDADMCAIEIAIHYAMKDIEEGQLNIENFPLLYECKYGYNDGVNGGKAAILNMFVSGTKTKSSTKYKDKADELTKFYFNKNKDISMVAGVLNSTVTKDVNGNEIELQGPHAYAVKDATPNTVTIVNPWDSNKEIKMSKIDFLNAFDELETTELSEKEVSDNYILKPINEKVTDIDEKTFKVDLEFKNGESITTTYVDKFAKEVLIKDKNGKTSVHKYLGDPTKNEDTEIKRYNKKGIIDYKMVVHNNNTKKVKEKFYIDYYDRTGTEVKDTKYFDEKGREIKKIKNPIKIMFKIIKEITSKNNHA